MHATVVQRCIRLGRAHAVRCPLPVHSASHIFRARVRSAMKTQHPTGWYRRRVASASDVLRRIRTARRHPSFQASAIAEETRRGCSSSFAACLDNRCAAVTCVFAKQVRPVPARLDLIWHARAASGDHGAINPVLYTDNHTHAAELCCPCSSHGTRCQRRSRRSTQSWKEWQEDLLRLPWYVCERSRTLCLRPPALPYV